jgi:hypothetical protein
MLATLAAAAQFAVGLPAIIRGDPRLQSCKAPQSFVLEHPTLKIVTHVERGYLRVSIELVATGPTSPDLTEALNPKGTSPTAFVQIDNQSPIILVLQPGRPVVLGIAALDRGSHILRNGIVYQDVLMNGGSVCIRL